MTVPARILIGTTTANGIVASDYVMSLTHMMDDLRRRGIWTELRMIDGPNLMVQRDVLADELLRSDCTHLALIGGNLRFPSDLCRCLLGSGQPVTGAICPRGAPDLERFASLAGSLPIDASLARAQEWDVELLDRSLRVENGFCQVRAIGTSFMLIGREAFARLHESGTLSRYEFSAGKLKLTAYFRNFFDDDPPSEPDHAFCRRWRDVGGEIWGYAAAPVGRVSEVHYGMPFARLMATSSQPIRPDASLA